MIDVKSILDDLGIDYKESGKNVSTSDVNIDCPFCGADKHLAINVRNGKTNCWVCNFEDVNFTWNGEAKRPNLAKVLVESSGEKWKDVKKAMEEWGWEPWVDSNKSPYSQSAVCRLPKNTSPAIDDSLALSYLLKRGFGTDTIIRYNLMCSKHESYKARIIIPIYIEGKLVNYTARDYTGHSPNRYKNAPSFYTIRRLNEALYNYDSAIGKARHKHIYLLEGPTDVWAMGEDSVAVFKSSLSAQQRNMILASGITSVTICFDRDAYSRAVSAAEELSPFMPKIKVIHLDSHKDVADLGRKEILYIEKRTEYFRD